MVTIPDVASPPRIYEGSIRRYTTYPSIDSGAMSLPKIDDASINKSSSLKDLFVFNNANLISIALSKNSAVPHVGSKTFAVNKPVKGGYFAGYYNGKQNIVGRRLFIEA